MSQILLIAPPSDLSRALGEALVTKSCTFDFAAGGVDAIRRLRRVSYYVVITNPNTTVEEDLALLDEMRQVRPGVRVIVLAPHSSPEEVIAALRARVFLCLSAPFDAVGIADMAAEAAAEPEWRWDIELLSSRCNWVSLRANCRLLNAERLVSFLREIRSDVADKGRETLMLGFDAHHADGRRGSPYAEYRRGYRHDNHENVRKASGHRCNPGVWLRSISSCRR